MKASTAKLADILRHAVAFAKSPTTVYLAAGALSRLGAIVLVPLYARRLTRPEYGDYALATSIVALVPAVLTFGLNAAVPRAFFNEKDERDGFRAAADVAVWSLCVAAIGAFAIAIGLSFVRLRGDGLFLNGGLRLVLCAGLGSTVTSVPSVILRAAQRPFRAAAFQLCEFFSVAGLGILSVGVLGRGFGGALEGLAIAYALNGCVALWFVVGVAGGRPRRGVVGPALRFGLPFVPHFLANWLQSVADRWTLKLTGFGEAMGGYSMAGQVASPTGMATAAWNDSACAQIGAAFRERGKPGLRAIFRPMQLRYLLSALIPSCFIAGLLPFLPLVLGQKFADVVWMVPLLLLVNIVDTQYFPAHAMIYFADRTGIIPYVTVGTAVCNVIGNVMLMPRMGIAGAILARAASVALRAAALWIAARVVLRDEHRVTEPQSG